MERSVIISAAVEGPVDEAVVRRLIILAGGRPGTIYGKNGKSFLRQKIAGYNNAARHSPWLVLMDLDHEADCAPPVCEEWLPDPAPYLCFRVAVREVEAWLMADAEALAGFLSVSRNRIPPKSENIDDPKNMMVNLARHSRRRDVYLDMVPRLGSGRQVGPAYVSRILEYIQDHWRPEVAAKRSDSLKRAIRCMRNFVEKAIDKESRIPE